MQQWIKSTDSFLSKQPRLKVTVYGPYGDYTDKLRRISQYLRENYGFNDTWIVEDRNGFRVRSQGEQYSSFIRNKSYYYLEVSNVNILVFYCNAYNQSVDFELKHLCDNLKDKIIDSIVFKDSACNMGLLFEGEIIDAIIKSECFYGNSSNAEEYIAEIANAYCLNILKRVYYRI